MSLFMLFTCLQFGYCKKADLLTTTPQIKNYIFQLPKKFKKTDTLPLVVFLHGAGTLNDFNKLQNIVKPILSHQSDYRFFLFAPLFTNQDNWKANFESLRTMLNEVIDQNPVDSTRIYLTGISMGGYFGMQFAIENPSTFAAFLSLAGGPAESGKWSESTLKQVGEIKNVPVRIYHGDKDITVFLDRSQTVVNAIKEAGGNAELIILPGRDHGILDIYAQDDAFSWLFKNQRNH
jgi:predicted peptidase